MTEAKKRRPAKKPASKGVVAPRVQTERERETAEKLRARFETFPERSKSKVIRKAGGNISIENDGDEMLYAADAFTAMGTTSSDFMNRTATQLSKVVSGRNELTSQDYNAAIAAMAAVEPANEAEALLAASMVAAHEGAMRCMRSMIHSDYADQVKMWGDLANKFMRTQVAQMEALAKIKRGGEQVVKYIHVHEGGQAVVAGTINQGGRQIEKGDGQSQATGADALEGCPALPSPDAQSYGVPLPSDAEREMSHARRDEPGGSERQ